jgi:hypothetical protein
LNFAYPGVDNLESTIDLELDSVARVGLEVLDELTQSQTGLGELQLSNLRIAATKVQKNETKSLILMNNSGVNVDDFFAKETKNTDGSERSFSLKQALIPKITGFEKLISLRSRIEDGIKVCCHFPNYRFLLSENSTLSSVTENEKLAFVSIKASGNSDGSKFWAPINMKRQGEFWSGELQISPVFRAYLSETFEESDKDPKIAFTLKENLSSKELLLGVLPYVSLEKPAPAEFKASTILKRSSGANDNRLEYLVTFPARTFNPGLTYEMMLIPISDGRIQLSQSKVELKQNRDGDWAASFRVDMATRLYPTAGQGFGGVIGAVIRTKSGEVLGKVQLGYLSETNLVSLP